MDLCCLKSVIEFKVLLEDGVIFGKMSFIPEWDGFRRERKGTAETRQLKTVQLLIAKRRSINPSTKYRSIWLFTGRLVITAVTQFSLNLFAWMHLASDNSHRRTLGFRTSSVLSIPDTHEGRSQMVDI